MGGGVPRDAARNSDSRDNPGPPWAPGPRRQARQRTPPRPRCGTSRPIAFCLLPVVRRPPRSIDEPLPPVRRRRRRLRPRRPLRRRRAADQARRAQQLQAVPGIPRAVQERHGPRPRRDQRRGRRPRPAARDRDPRRHRQPRRRGPRRRGAHLPRKGRAADGHVRVQRRPRRGRRREAAQGAVSRVGTPDRQDRLGKRQPVHVPAARVDVHADGDAGARGGEARQAALGDRLPELRVRAIGNGGVQAADDRAAGRRHRVRRSATRRSSRLRWSGGRATMS